MHKQDLESQFLSLYSHPATHRFSAPGRTEIGGNHTDHQHGVVLAASIDRMATALAAPNGTRTLTLHSVGFAPCSVSLDALTIDASEYNTTQALLRGVAAGVAARGGTPFGLDLLVQSDVACGSGLSSSAALEVLLGAVFSALWQGAVLSPVDLARIGQTAENRFFGKPCGLMDQLACAEGNLSYLDFADPEHPLVERLDVDFAAYRHTLCIVDTGADHADLTDAYAAIPKELASVCAFFGKAVLREVDESLFYGQLPALRKEVGDRAVLRAMHVYEENRRVLVMRAALLRGDFSAFLTAVRDSGRSSWTLLQNVTPPAAILCQPVAYALHVAEHLLDGRGAVRVHGGGFAGTILCIVPNDLLPTFAQGIDRLLAPKACSVLSVVPYGARALPLEAR